MPTSSVRIYAVFLVCMKLATASILAYDASFVVSGSPLVEDQNLHEDDEQRTNLSQPLLPSIVTMHVKSKISDRYARTTVISKVKNPDILPREATFFLILPQTAFISKFVMEIGGKEYRAYVMSKKRAKRLYDTNKSKGSTAGHIAVSAKDSNQFAISVNIGAGEKATFFLTYEELLQRQNNMYETVINIHPGQIVKDLKVEVHINESRPLTFVRTPSLRTDNEIFEHSQQRIPNTEVKVISKTIADIKFSPTIEDQRNFAIEHENIEEHGLSGQFIVQYGVAKDPYGGEILLKDGYFVHFFAPTDFELLPKHVIFVLDISSSMEGIKIDQLKEAMASMLEELNGDNLLSVITFSDLAYVHDIRRGIAQPSPFNHFDLQELEAEFKELGLGSLPDPARTTPETIDKAKNIATDLEPGGLTNMMAALLTALSLAQKSQRQYQKKYQPVILLLTDGMATTTSMENITEHITHLNNDIQAPIFGISLGHEAVKSFLRELSTENNGFSRHIFEDADVSLQLQQFYRQISNPVLSNIKFYYRDVDEDDVTITRFLVLQNGSEIVVAGRYDAKKNKFPAMINASGSKGPMSLLPKFGRPISSLERLWAYVTVKQILQQSDAADDNAKKELTKKAVDLALKYSFVTDVTSLVVYKPDENVTTAVNVRGASTKNRPEKTRTGSTGVTLRDQFPWLTAVLNSDGIITLPQGTFDIGENVIFSYYSLECQHPIGSNSTETGICTLLKVCPPAIHLLTDIDVYQRHLCALGKNKYAGICCPAPRKHSK